MNRSSTLPHCARAVSVSCLIWLAACQSGAQPAGGPETKVAANPDGVVAVPGEASDSHFPAIGNTVYFETNSSTLTADAQVVLKEQARYLTDYPVLTITVEGHADERGTREYNLALGERRANATASYLAALGIAAGRISIITYGKERPACQEATEPCWAQSRRTVTSVNSD